MTIQYRILTLSRNFRCARFCFCLFGLMTASPDLAFAQMKLLAKAAAGRQRDPLFHLDRRADGRQCRRHPQGNPPGQDRHRRRCSTSAIPPKRAPTARTASSPTSRVNGQTLTGTTQSIGDKLPVTVKLTRKPTGDSFEFNGQISVGQTVTEVISTDNSDLSEKEFLDNQTTDDGITPQPKDFTEVSPESVGVKVKLDAALDFLKSLKGQNVEVGLEQPHRLLRCAARRRADHQPHRRSGSRRGADRQGEVGAGRGRRRLDQRQSSRWSAPSALRPPTGATATSSTRTSSQPRSPACWPKRWRRKRRRRHGTPIPEN